MKETTWVILFRTLETAEIRAFHCRDSIQAGRIARKLIDVGYGNVQVEEIEVKI